MAELLSVQVPCGRTVGGYAEFHKNLVASAGGVNHSTPTMLTAKQRAYTAGYNHNAALNHNQIR